MIRSLRLNIQKKIRTIEDAEININNNFPNIKNFPISSHYKTKITTIYINIENYQKLMQKLKEKEKLKFINLYAESILKIFNYYLIDNYHLFGTEIYGFIEHYKANSFAEGNLLTAAIEINSFLSNLPFKINYKIVLLTGIEFFSIIEINKRKKTLATINKTVYLAKEIFEKTTKTNLIYLNEVYEKNNFHWLQQIPKDPCSYPKQVDSKILNEKIFELNCVFADWKIENLNKKG
ncbi:MAG: hypothetical protein HPPSJP_3810 [Candidatus Hepatoplasma scabrum]|nr:MAG: hypothetical protein HPPSJP_3810 [Candidatus Hepatoplasma sp.]